MALTPSAFILRLSDDILEHIFRVAIVSRGHHGGRMHTALKLSHICRRLRMLIVARATFWTNIQITAKTKPKLIRYILQRSREMPLNIGISGIRPGESDTRQIISDPLDVLCCNIMTRFASFAWIKLLLNNTARVGFPERLATALGPNPPAVQRLDLCATPCDPLLGLFGPHLTYLKLQYVTGFSLRWLRSVLQLAPNLEVFRFISPTFTGVEGIIMDFDSLNACPSPKLQSLELSIEEEHILEAIFAVIHRIYPSILLKGRRVWLNTFDNGSSLAKMDLQRFTSADILVVYGCRIYEIAFLDPAAGDYATGSRNSILRGFQCSPLALHHHGAYLMAIRRIASTVRSVRLRHLTVKKGFKSSETFLEGLTEIPWPCLQHLTLKIYIDAEMLEDMISQRPYAIPRTSMPSLAKVDIVLRAGWDMPIGRWARHRTGIHSQSASKHVKQFSNGLTSWTLQTLASL